jgi:hypothetical protein
MNKKSWLICIGGLFIGLVLGYFIGILHAGSIMASGLTLLKETELGHSGDVAFQAYQHESRPIAIYALSQDLATLQDAQQLVDDPASSFRLEVARRMMFVHARLAKLGYGTNQISEALQCAQAAGPKFSSITNESELSGMVAKFDQKGVY